MTTDLALIVPQEVPPSVCCATIDVSPHCPTIDVEVVEPEPSGAGSARLTTAEALEPGTAVEFRNEFHDTTAKCKVRKNGTISARVYRRLSVELCEAAKIRDLCGCNGPHGDPSHVLIPLGHPLDRCEWQVCQRPAAVEPSRTAAIAKGVGRFTFLVALPYMVAATWILGGVVLRRLPRMVGFVFKLGAFGFVIWAVAMFCMLMHAAVTM